MFFPDQSPNTVKILHNLTNHTVIQKIKVANFAPRNQRYFEANGEKDTVIFDKTPLQHKK